MSRRNERLNAKFDELKSAVAAKDGARAGRVVEEMKAIDPAAGERVLTGGIAAGLRRLSGRS